MPTTCSAARAEPELCGESDKLPGYGIVSQDADRIGPWQSTSSSSDSVHLCMHPRRCCTTKPPCPPSCCCPYTVYTGLPFTIPALVLQHYRHMVSGRYQMTTTTSIQFCEANFMLGQDMQPPSVIPPLTPGQEICMHGVQPARMPRGYAVICDWYLNTGTCLASSTINVNIPNT